MPTPAATPPLLPSPRESRSSSYRARTIAALHGRLDAPLSSTLAVALPRFATGRDLVAFQRLPSNDRADKDAVLAILMAACLANPRDAEPFELLFAAMFPVVDSGFFLRVRKAKSRRNADAGAGDQAWPDESWAFVVEAFVEVVRGYPLERRPRKIAANILGLFLHAVDDRELDETRSAVAEKFMEDVVAPVCDQARELPFQVAQDEEPPAPPTLDEVTAADRWLSEHGIADPLDRAVLVGIIGCERSSEEVAKQIGANAPAVRKRLQRAQEKLAQAPAVRRLKRRRNFSGDEAPKKTR